MVSFKKPFEAIEVKLSIISQKAEKLEKRN